MCVLGRDNSSVEAKNLWCIVELTIRSYSILKHLKNSDVSVMATGYKTHKIDHKRTSVTCTTIEWNRTERI